MADRYKFRFEGDAYVLSSLLLSEARAIQKATGRTMGGFDAALKEGDSDCLAALIWVARKRKEPTLTYEQVDGDLFTFDVLCDTDGCLEVATKDSYCAQHQPSAEDEQAGQAGQAGQAEPGGPRGNGQMEPAAEAAALQ